MRKLFIAGAGLAALGMYILKTKLGKNKEKNELEVIGTFRYPKEIKESVVIALDDCIKVDDKLVYYRKYKPIECSNIVEKDLVAEDFVLNIKEGLVDRIHSLVIEVKEDYQSILIGFKDGRVKLVEGRIIKKES